MNKPKPSRKRKKQAPAARRRSRGPNDVACALCDLPMAGEPEWSGDIEAALSLHDVPPNDSRKIHQSCGELVPAMIAEALRKMNRRHPELRLRTWPWPARCAPFSVPIPNLKVCAEYFRRYNSTRSETDALPRISNLLLDFHRKHPVEWECCGWRNDAIADVVLGYTPGGYVENGKTTALLWLKQYWKHEACLARQLATDVSDKRQRASDAASDIELLQGGKDYARCAYLVRWLNENWSKLTPDWSGKRVLSTEEAERLLVQSAEKAYLKKQPRCALAPAVLREVIAAYNRCWEATAGVERLQSIPLVPSAVILELAAIRHHVSSRLVATVRRHNKV